MKPILSNTLINFKKKPVILESNNKKTRISLLDINRPRTITKTQKQKALESLRCWFTTFKKSNKYIDLDFSHLVFPHWYEWTFPESKDIINFLERINANVHPSDLHKLTVQKLNLKGVGFKTFNDIFLSIEEDLNTIETEKASLNIDEIKSSLTQLLSLLTNVSITEYDLRLGNLIKQIDPLHLGLKNKIKLLLDDLNNDPNNFNYKQALLAKQFHDRLTNINNMSLYEEIYDICYALSIKYDQARKNTIANAKELLIRNTKILTMRYSADNDKLHTLQSIGNKYDMTRERVRQIIEKHMRFQEDYSTYSPCHAHICSEIEY